MNFNTHTLIEKIFDNNKSNDLQEILGMETKYKYVIIDEDNDVRDLSNSNIYFSNEIKSLYEKIKYYTEYICDYTIEYSIEDKSIDISIRDRLEISSIMPCIAIYGVSCDDKLQIENYLEQKYGDKAVRSD